MIFQSWSFCDRKELRSEVTCCKAASDIIISVAIPCDWSDRVLWDIGIGDRGCLLFRWRGADEVDDAKMQMRR